MPEGFTMPDGGTAGPVHNDATHKPPPDAVAPRGYTWNRGTRAWAPKIKGQILYKAASDIPAPSAPDDALHGRGGEPQGDPDPGWFVHDDDRPEADKGGKRKLSIDDVPKEVVNDIAGFAGLVGAPLLAMLQQADPYCGSALAQSFEPIVDACLPLICRSEKIVRYFTGDQSDWLLWGKLALALRPVAQAVLQHHVLKSVEVVRDASTGQVRVVERRRGAGHGDHLTPPQPEMQYAA